MTRNWLLAPALMGVSIAAAPVGAAEMPSEEAASVLVQPAAVKAVEDMSAYLRTLKQFKVGATTTMDDILDNGQLVEIAGVTTTAARLPDRLRVTGVND